MLLRLLVTILNRNGEIESGKKPWEKDNSWRISPKILPEFKVSKAYYRDMYSSENITAGITNVSFVVTKV